MGQCCSGSRPPKEAVVKNAVTAPPMPAQPHNLVLDPDPDDVIIEAGGDLQEDEEAIRVSRFFINDKGNLDDEIVSSIEVEGGRRVVRRAIGKVERAFVFDSLNGRCYLCRTPLQFNSAWHIEHVVAFASDPSKNDVLGNMLPACQTCNMRKNKRSLVSLIEKDVTFDLDTEAATVAHLNTEAKNAILAALHVKRELALQQQESSTDQNRLLIKIMSHIENRVSMKAKALKSSVESIDKILETYNIPRIHEEHVKLDDELSAKLRQGGFGFVRHGVYNGSDVAIKSPKFSNEVTLSSALIEVSFLSRLRHKHIVGFHGVFFREGFVELDRLCLCLDWCTNTLNDKEVIRNIDPVKVFLQIVSAVKYMHSQEPCIIHRDIKPLNILICRPQVGESWADAAVAKLCDFGASKALTHGRESVAEHTVNAGTADFRAPEVRKGFLLPSGDIYALGKTMSHVKDPKYGGAGNIRTSKNPLATIWDDIIKECTTPESRYKDRKITTADILEERLKSIETVSARARLSLSPKPDNPTATIRSPSANREEDQVFVSASAKTKVNMKGKKMSYHFSSTCGGGADSLQIVSMEEATELGHAPCKRCTGAGR
jgi:serine/threonine protein kinase/5-methylcytosine-specific restriction endonuclease McrA